MSTQRGSNDYLVQLWFFHIFAILSRLIFSCEDLTVSEYYRMTISPSTIASIMYKLIYMLYFASAAQFAKHMEISFSLYLIRKWSLGKSMRGVHWVGFLPMLTSYRAWVILTEYMPWWRHQMENFPRYWPFVRGIHRPPVNSPRKGQWRRSLMFSSLCV